MSEGCTLSRLAGASQTTLAKRAVGRSLQAERQPQRLFEPLGYVPPAEFEESYYQRQEAQEMAA